MRHGSSKGTLVDLPASGALVTMPSESRESTSSKRSMKSWIVEQNAVPKGKMMENVMDSYKRNLLK